MPQVSDTRPFSIPLLLVFFSPYAEPFGGEQTGGSCSNPSEVLSLHCISCAPLWVCHGMEGLVSWCNGSTTGFGSVCQGSNPCETTTVEGVLTPSFLLMTSTWGRVCKPYPIVEDSLSSGTEMRLGIIPYLYLK